MWYYLGLAIFCYVTEYLLIYIGFHEQKYLFQACYWSIADIVETLHHYVFTPKSRHNEQLPSETMLALSYRKGEHGVSWINFIESWFKQMYLTKPFCIASTHIDKATYEFFQVKMLCSSQRKEHQIFESHLIHVEKNSVRYTFSVIIFITILLL